MKLLFTCVLITFVTFTASFPITKLQSKAPSIIPASDFRSDSYGRSQCICITNSVTRLSATTTNSSPSLFESIKANVQDRPKSAILLLKLWLLFTFYAFKIVPPDVDPASTIDIIQKCFTPPYDGTVNPIFISIFNLLGVYPAIFASLLLCGSKKQALPAAPFVFSSFALGFFGLGPYLALRRSNTEGTKSNAGFGHQVFESKIVPVLLLLSSAYLVYYGASAQLVDGSDKIENFIALFQSKALVHVSTVDFTILSLVMWEPLKEDMIRRKWDGPNAIIVSLLPIFGPLLYLLFRPKLRED